MPQPQPQSATVETIHRLKEEIDKLTEQQADAMKSATYVGMTTDRPHWDLHHSA